MLCCNVCCVLCVVCGVCGFCRCLSVCCLRCFFSTSIIFISVRLVIPQATGRFEFDFFYFVCFLLTGLFYTVTVTTTATKRINCYDHNKLKCCNLQHKKGPNFTNTVQLTWRLRHYYSVYQLFFWGV